MTQNIDYSTLSPMERYGGSITTLTGSEPELYRFELNIRGLAEDAQGNIIQVGKSLLNEKGINYVLGMVRSIVNRVTFMSNYNEELTSKLLIDYMETIITKLCIRKDEFGIGMEDRDTILVETRNLCVAACRRAINEGDKRFLKGSVTEVKNTLENNRQGGFGNLLGWSSRGKQ